MYRYFITPLLILFFIFISLYALNPNIKFSEIVIYREGALLRVTENIDISGLDIFGVYGRYDIFENNSYVGKQVKFIWNQNEKRGIVERFENGVLIIKDEEGFLYRLSPEAVIFKESDLVTKTLVPKDHTYLGIAKVGWSGKHMLRIDQNKGILDVGIEMYNDNYMDIKANTVELIDTYITSFYPRLKPQFMYQSLEQGIEQGRVLESKIKYKLDNLILPAKSRISRSVAKYELDLNRTNTISLSIPYTKYIVYRGHPELSISFQVPIDIASGTLDIYDRSLLVNSRSIEHYLKDNFITLNLWENKGIEYLVEMTNNIVTQDYRTYIVDGKISVQLKNNNNIAEEVVVEVNVWEDYEVSGDFVLDKGKLVARYKLSPGESKTLFGRFYRK